MVGKITIAGSGQIGDLADGWTVQEDITPLFLNDSSGSVGSVSFNGLRNITGENYSEWAVNNPTTFTHTNESNPTTGLGNISGKIETVKVSGSSASGTIGTILSVLNVVRSAPTVGNYTAPGTVLGPTIPIYPGDPARGSFNGVRDVSFDSSGNMFVFDGFNCRVIKFTKDPTLGIWYFVTATSSGYNAGSGNGQFGDGGGSPPVGGVGFIACDSSGNVFVTDAFNNRVQKFNNSLVYQSQFGSVGSTNGLFVSPTGIAIDSSSNIYVMDNGNNRIQKFTSAGTYSSQFGSSGTGNGQFSGQAYGLTISGTDLFVCDGWNGTTGGARVQKFNTSGTYVGQFGSLGRQAGQFGYNSTGNPFTSGPYDIAVDSGGNIYVLDPANNRVQVFTSSFAYIGSFGSWGGTIGSFTNPRGLGRNPISGNIWVGDFLNNRIVEFVPATTYTIPLATVYQNYVHLVDPTLTITYSASSNPSVNYPSWTDNVWTKLNQLATANGQEIAVVGGSLTVRDIGSTSLPLSESAISPTVSVSSTNSAQAIDITYQNTRYGDGIELYNAALEGQTFSISSGATAITTVNTKNYPNVINNPIPVDSIYGPGTYQILATGNLAIPPALWIASGGLVTVSLGSNPGQLDITMSGPVGGDIDGYPSPYQLAYFDSSSNSAITALSITGSGVLTNPVVLHLLTGADPNVTGTETLTISPDNIFLSTEAQTYDRGVWTSDAVGGPAVTLDAEIPISSLTGFGLGSGSLVNYDNTTFRIESSTINNASISVNGTRRVTSGQEAVLWATRTAGDHATFWSGHPAEDATIKPLLN